MNTYSDATVAIAFAQYMVDPNESAIDAIVDAVTVRPDLLQRMGMTLPELRQSLLDKAALMRAQTAGSAQARTAALLHSMKGAKP